MRTKKYTWYDIVKKAKKKKVKRKQKHWQGLNYGKETFRLWWRHVMMARSVILFSSMFQVHEGGKRAKPWVILGLCNTLTVAMYGLKGVYSFLLILFTILNYQEGDWTPWSQAFGVEGIQEIFLRKQTQLNLYDLLLTRYRKF